MKDYLIEPEKVIIFNKIQQMENNYSVYQHVTPDGMYYFGQTNDIKRRWESNGIHYKETSLYPYIEKFGWDNIKHIILFENQSKENALWIEDFLITTAQEDGVCINKNRSGLVSKEDGYRRRRDKQYYEQNKDKKKQYYEQNKDKKKQYYEQNKDKKKQYYEQNKQQILEQHKQYYEQNKQQRREYQRKYRKRKKKEKQFKELGCLKIW